MEVETDAVSLAMKTIDRDEAIRILRTECLALVDDEHSICDVAARRGIMCHGFKQWSFTELKRKYDWMLQRRPNVTPEQLQDLANRWQLARQFVNEEGLACDNLQHGDIHAQCRGWDDFDEEQLAKFVEELTGEAVRVQAAATP